ncbi:MAG: family 16 glycosylhydrolase [Acidimicrobiales bacterium]
MAGAAGANSSTIKVEAEQASIRTVGGPDGPGWNLWSNGRIGHSVQFGPARTHRLTVRARANSEQGVDPVLEVSIDGRSYGRASVQAESGWRYRDYHFDVSTTPGRHEVSLAFVNDPNRPGNNVDLVIDYFTVTPVKAASSATTTSTSRPTTTTTTAGTASPPSEPTTTATVGPPTTEPTTTTTSTTTAGGGSGGGAGGSGGDARSPYIPAGYSLTWNDEFDTLSLDKAANGNGNWATKWVGFNVLSLAGNGDRCMKAYPEFTGTGGPPLGIETHRVDNGVLTLFGRPIPENRRAQFWNYEAACGMLSGQLSHDQTYGYWETRIRITNVSQGHHWGVWMLPANDAWPPEIDILEVVGRKPGDPNVGPGRFHFTGHFDDANGKHTGNGRAVDAPGPADAWYTLGLQWTQNEVVWYLDGKEVHRLGNFFGTVPAYFLITPEIGGNWPGPTSGQTVWPMSMDVDYVRIYSR